MKELVIRNVQIVIDAHETDANAEAFAVLDRINAEIQKTEGQPIVVLTAAMSESASYRDNGD